ncbi:MAG: inosine/xanthosine triphosphatase [Patescibacteria group bacterium]|jgi:inosine/xanthosine triphosphatase
MKILVGSKNPTKINAVKQAFAIYFTKSLEVVGVDVDSRVTNQPTNNEIFIGAENRARSLKKFNDEQKGDASYFVGIEGGAMELHGRTLSSSVACIICSNGAMEFGVSPLYQLPHFVAKKLHEGAELGGIMDMLMGTTQTKQKTGAVNFFSKGKIDRTEMMRLAVFMALMPIINKEVYT